MHSGNNQLAFLNLLRAGLWEKEVQLLSFGELDYSEILHLAEEQSVVGLVTAGLEHVKDKNVPKEVLLQFIGQSLQLEQQNTLMNDFVESLIKKLRQEGVYTLLVKGQGIAQCYEKPLWRSSGDVDLLLDVDNYRKAKRVLIPLALYVDKEFFNTLHLGLTIKDWIVELHGTFRSQLWGKIDRVLDEVQADTIEKHHVRVWRNGEEDVLLPDPDNDVIFVFAHILQHYFKGGIGLRQICDWCRLLWSYRDSIDSSLLETRIKEMGLMSEWNVFATLAINELGMPQEAVPLFLPSSKFRKRSKKVLSIIIISGNSESHNTNKTTSNSFILRKSVSLWRHTKDGLRHFIVFPLDSIKVWIYMIQHGMQAVLKGDHND